MHLPALSGWLHFDPIDIVSGLAEDPWRSNGLLAGFPGWIDPNAGVTTQALGAFAARAWLHGTVPWWDPLAGLGMPLVAEQQSAAFFLPFVLLLALPHGLLLLRIVLMMVAGVAGLALLRRLGLRTPAALAGAALFQLNGTFAWLAHGPIMPVAFLPLILLGLEQARAGIFPVWTALGTGWSLLAGFPETAALNLLFAACWGAVRLAQGPHRARYAAATSGAVLLGALLAAPSVWPFIEALPRSFLGSHAGVPDERLTPVNAALLLFPYLFGNIQAHPLMLHASPRGLWWTVGGYTDLLAVGLAVLALGTGRRHGALRWMLALWVAVTASRAFALPAAVAVFDAVPVLRQARIILWVLPSWSMACAVLAAMALDDAARGLALSRPLRVAAIATATGAALALAAPTVAQLWRSAPGSAAFPVVSVLGAVSLFGLLLALLRRPMRAGRAAALVIANAAALFALPLLAGSRGRHVDTAAMADLADRQGFLRTVSFGPLVPNYGSLFGIAQIDANMLPAPQSWVDYVRRHFDPDMDGVLAYHGALPPPDRLAPLLDAYQQAGVGFALTWPGEGAAMPALGARKLRQDERLTLWALPHPAPYFEAPGCALKPLSRDALDATCPQPTALLRRELFWPGWHASVDGRTVPVRPAAEIVQGVAVPAGSHRIRFAYAPPGIAWAWTASAAAAVLLVTRSGFALFPRLRRCLPARRRAAPPPPPPACP